MKKSLLAVAAMTAFAGAAQAQSSVTVYGILDVGYVGYNTAVSTNTASAGTGNGLLKTQSSSIGQNAESTSRLGFKGSEDLGGGTQAIFTIEMGLTPQSGNLSGSPATNPKYDLQQTTNSSGAAIDNRQAFAGLHKNGWGSVTMGRQYTLVFNSVAATDAAGMNNMAGDAVYGGFSNAAAGPNYYLEGFTNRADNTLILSSDKFAGFSGSAAYTLNNANSTLASGGQAVSGTSGAGTGTNAATGQNVGSGNVNWGGWALSGDYTWNKLYITAATQQFRTKYDNGVGVTENTMNLFGGGPSAGQLVGSLQAASNATTNYVFGPTNSTDKQTFVGATYDFGILKAYAQYINRTIAQNTLNGGMVNGAVAGVTAVGNTLSRSAEQIGVRGYITPTIEAWAQAGIGKMTAAISTTAATSLAPVGFTTYQLGTNYYLSKRTNLYGIYGASQSSSPIYNSGAAGYNNSYAVGVRHTF